MVTKHWKRSMISKGWKKKNPLAACVAAFCIIMFLNGNMNSLTRISKSFTEDYTRDNITAPKSKDKENVNIPDNYTGIPCNYTLNLPQEEILEKIESYEFPGVQNYIADLFPKIDSLNMPDDPLFVSAFSSNHYKEGLAMIFNFNKASNNTRKLIIYDIGLSSDEVKKVKEDCQCEVRQFPFEKFPKHVSILQGCPWKPIVIQLVAKEHPFVIWMDASIRLRTSNLDELVKLAKKRGVLASKTYSLVAYQTSIETFRFLNEIPCLFLRRIHELEANFIILYHNEFIKKYLMIPWVSCALVKGCMVTNEDVEKAFDCSGKRHYFHCHRFDQSVFSILMYRLFHKTITNHFIERNKWHSVCRGCEKKEWLCPRMLC